MAVGKVKSLLKKELSGSAPFPDRGSPVLHVTAHGITWGLTASTPQTKLIAAIGRDVMMLSCQDIQYIGPTITISVGAMLKPALVYSSPTNACAVFPRVSV